MKKSKIISIILLTVMILCMTAPAVLPASAASDGIKDFKEAAGGKNILMYPLYLTGGDGFNDAEGSDRLLDGKTSTKYGTSSLPYNAEWKYEKAYTVERIILRTGGDNKSYPRRMGDGWTLSGSNDGSSWTVIYTGVEDDVLNENNTCYYIDLPDNKTEYQYYQLNAEDAASDQTDTAVQLSMCILCVNESVGVPEERPYITRTNIIAGFGASVIEAPDFDSGKYFESNAAEGTHICRPEEDVQTEYCGADYIGRVDDNDKALDGTLLGNIGYTAAGEWVQYTVKVKKDGIYKFDAWVASDNDAPGSVDIYLNGDDNLIGSAASVKAGWQNYSKVTAAQGIEMTEGEHIIKVLFPTGGVNFQALEVARTGNIEVPTEEPTEPEIAADNAEAEGGETPAAGNAAADDDDDGDGGISPVIFIIGGAVILVIIIVIIIIVTKKKK